MQHDKAESSSPLTITIKRACELSGYGPTTIWRLIKEKRLKVVRVAALLLATALAGCVSQRFAPAQPQRFNAPAPYVQTEPRQTGGPYTREREDREFGSSATARE